MKKNLNGFTIVELLIVIVVIAILAAITIVAYNGIQSRANDSAVQSDISQYAKKIQLFIADNGRPPQSTAELDSLNVKESSTAYANHANAVMYCLSGSNWSIAGASKSGTNGYYYNSSTSSVTRRAWWNAGNPCSDFGVQHSVVGDYAAYKQATRTWSTGGTHTV
jgi:prepilin-type N-terminal cleavage/methylation domain-containing protein